MMSPVFHPTVLPKDQASIDGPWTGDTIIWAYNDAARSVNRTAPGGFTETTISE